MFKEGQVVTWESQAGGYHARKKGVVVRVMSGEEIPIMIASVEFTNHKRMFDGYTFPGKEKFAYLVEVRDGKTQKAAPKLYMPYPSKLVACDN